MLNIEVSMVLNIKSYLQTCKLTTAYEIKTDLLCLQFKITPIHHALGLSPLVHPVTETSHFSYCPFK